ncbi:hypothetical protein HYX70_02210 [Candidatus Saccharibacteria bacterium]|nr:hypothetical protein [Candidatus Saccharibacteria bacterium]
MKRLPILIPFILAAASCTGQAGPNDSAPTKTICPPDQVSGNVVFYGPNDPCPPSKTTVVSPHFGGTIPDVRGCPPMTEGDPRKLDPGSKCSSVFNNPAVVCEARGNCDVVPPRYCIQDPTPPCIPPATVPGVSDRGTVPPGSVPEPGACDSTNCRPAGKDASQDPDQGCCEPGRCPPRCPSM